LEDDDMMIKKYWLVGMIFICLARAFD